MVDTESSPPAVVEPTSLACRTCGACDLQLHFDSVAPPERVSDLVVRDQGRCISCVVNGKGGRTA
ncbi:hypothetical protein UK12_27450 [Saccharothrix sp. ST-888]|nr:hypothetical protein UK12_27450 [Saccharothrix sp. ST-888]